MPTLLERYQIKNSLLIEGLILEKFDKQTMIKATELIKKLKTIDFKGIDSLAAGRDAAVQDVNNVISGSSDQGTIRKILNLFKSKDNKENPLLDSLAFADAIKNFFDNFVPWLEANATGAASTDVSVKELIAGNNEDDAETQKKLNSLKNIVVKGFKPEGVFGSIGKNWQKKYFKNNYNKLANDIMNANVDDLITNGKKISSSLSNTQAVGQSAVGASEVSAKQPTSSSETEKAAGTQSSSGTTPPESTKKSSKVPGTGKDDRSKAEKIYDEIENDFGNIDTETVKQVISVLAYNDLIK